MYGHTLPTRTAFLKDKLALHDHYKQWCAGMRKERERQKAAKCPKCGRTEDSCNERAMAGVIRRD